MERLDAPLNLMYLAAIAENCRWEASIVDMEHPGDPLPEADIYGVTATSPQWPDAILLSKRLEREFPTSTRMIGGSHISAVTDLSKSTFNIAVLGEAEKTLAEFLHGKVSYPLFAYSILTGDPVEHLDIIPFPAHHLIDWNNYKRGIYWGNECLALAVPMMTSRGCPYNCTFCGSHTVFGRTVRFRSGQNVIAEIKHVKETMGYRGFNMHDDTFCLSRERVVLLSNEIIAQDLDIVWRCLSRVDTVHPELLNLMGLAGCKEIILGVESGSQSILNRLRKGTKVKQNVKAMRMVKDNPLIQLKVGIIVGSPGETWQTVRETEEMLKECPPDFWNVSVFSPYPGSYAWKYPEKLGIKILTRDLREYRQVGKEFKGNVVVETEEMNKQDIERARDELIDLCLSFG